MVSKDKHHILKQLPGVDHLMVLAMKDERFQEVPVSVIKTATRNVLKQTRDAIVSNNIDHCNPDQILTKVANLSASIIAPRLRPVINATGVVLHTNLGALPACPQRS